LHHTGHFGVGHESDLVGGTHLFDHGEHRTTRLLDRFSPHRARHVEHERHRDGPRFTLCGWDLVGAQSELGVHLSCAIGLHTPLSEREATVRTKATKLRLRRGARVRTGVLVSSTLLRHGTTWDRRTKSDGPPRRSIYASSRLKTCLAAMRSRNRGGSHAGLCPDAWGRATPSPFEACEDKAYAGSERTDAD